MRGLISTENYKILDNILQFRPPQSQSFDILPRVVDFAYLLRHKHFNRRSSWENGGIDRRVKHASHGRMKTITVRDVRQRWPGAEQALETEGEIIITRDGKPVARLLPVEPEPAQRKRFDPEENPRRREEMWGEDSGINTLALLQADRDGRELP